MGTTGIQDATNPANGLKVNSDGSINTTAVGGGAGDLAKSGTINSASGAGSTIVLDLGSGQASWGFQVTAGTFSSGTTLVFEGSDDAGTPTNWDALVGYNYTTSAPDPAPITSISGPQTLPLEIRGSAAGYAHIQVRCSLLHAGDTLTGRLTGSTASFGAGSAVNMPDGANVVEGQTTDANTASTMMGRLTKIRDLLLATLTVSGTVTANIDATNSTHLANIDTATVGLATQATLAQIKTDVDKIPASPAQEGGNLASSLTQQTNTNTILGTTTDAAVVGDNNGTLSAKLRGLTKILNSVWDSVNNLLNTNHARVAGTAVSVNAGTADAGTQRMTLASDQKVPTKAASGDFADGAIATIGAQADTTATTDSGTFSLIALFKRLLVNHLPAALGSTTSANSLPVVIASDQAKLPTKAASGDFADGAINTLGAQADAAYTDASGATSGTSQGLFKGMFVKLAAIATSVAGVLQVKRSTVAVYSLASVATSGSTQNSGDLTVGPYTEISLDINTTAQSGTNPTIQYFYERKAADGIYYVLWQSAVLTAAANTLSTSIGAGMAYNQSLGVTGRLRWVVGGTSTPTFTHTANIQGK